MRAERTSILEIVEFDEDASFEQKKNIYNSI